MHEQHLIKELFNDLLKDAQKNQVSKITSVTIRLGEFTEINPEILKHFFQENSIGTILEKATLNLETGTIRELRLVSYTGK